MAHEFPEAFHHLLYRADTGEEEWVWNSRDGAAPTVILLRSGARAEQVQTFSAYEPRYVPPVGQRVFVDLNAERCKEITDRKVDETWGHHQFPLSRVYRNKAEAREQLFHRFFADGRQPDLVVVNEWLHDHFAREAVRR